jgi:anti-anti-sigma factor
MALVISVGEPAAVTVLTIDGELDMNTAPALLDAAGELIDAGRSRLVLDLGGVGFCDSAGLGVFARLKRRVDEVGGELALARPALMVRRVLELTGLTELIGVYESVDEARAATVAG